MASSERCSSCATLALCSYSGARSSARPAFLAHGGQHLQVERVGAGIGARRQGEDAAQAGRPCSGTTTRSSLTSAARCRPASFGTALRCAVRGHGQAPVPRPAPSGPASQRVACHRAQRARRGGRAGPSRRRRRPARPRARRRLLQRTQPHRPRAPPPRGPPLARARSATRSRAGWMATRRGRGGVLPTREHHARSPRPAAGRRAWSAQGDLVEAPSTCSSGAGGSPSRSARRPRGGRAAGSGRRHPRRRGHQSSRVWLASSDRAVRRPASAGRTARVPRSPHVGQALREVGVIAATSLVGGAEVGAVARRVEQHEPLPRGARARTGRPPAGAITSSRHCRTSAGVDTVQVRPVVGQERGAREAAGDRGVGPAEAGGQLLPELRAAGVP